MKLDLKKIKYWKQTVIISTTNKLKMSSFHIASPLPTLQPLNFISFKFRIF